MKILFIFLMVLIIFIISVILGAQNNQLVTFDYLLAQGEYRVSSLVAFLFSIGFVSGWIICGFFWIKLRVALIRAKRKIKSLENQISPNSNTSIKHIR